MKVKATFFLFFLLAGGGAYLGYSHLFSGAEYYQPPTKDAFALAEQKGEGQNIHGAIAHYHRMRSNQYTNRIDRADVEQALGTARNLKTRASRATEINWEEMGPSTIGGRTRAIIVDNSNHNVLYAGAVSGGIYKSTNQGASWRKVYTGLENLCIVSMIQTSDGTLYFGTGEQNFTRGASGIYNSGFIGLGIWKSTDRGETWEYLEETRPQTPFNENDRWDNVNVMADDPTDPNTFYAGTDDGLMVSRDAGETFQVLYDPAYPVVSELRVSNDGMTIYAVFHTQSMNQCRTYRSDDKGQNWTMISSQDPKAELLPQPCSRLRIAIAPSNNNILYASAASAGSNLLLGIYRSEDKGQTWQVIGQRSATFNPFFVGSQGQGDYDNIIAVDPTNPNRVFLGGISYWQWTNKGGGNWTPLAGLLDFSNIANPYYIHADKHEIVFDTIADPYIMYVGTDGGIYRSADAENNLEPTFAEANLGYVTTQFYSVAPSPTGFAVGGTQDNGTILVDRTGLDARQGFQVLGGDGGYAAVSQLQPRIIFAESQYGAIRRSQDLARTFSQFYDVNIDPNELGGGGDFGAPFVTPFDLWENRNDPLTTQTVIFIADQDYEAGDTITLSSPNASIDFEYFLPQDLLEGQEIVVPNPVQSKLAIGIYTGIWMTKQALNFSRTPTWFRIFPRSGTPSNHPTAFAWSNDGDVLYVGYSQGSLYRISGLQNPQFNQLLDSVASLTNPQYVLQFPSPGIDVDTFNAFRGRFISAIALDPTNMDRAVITLGNYGNNNFISMTDNLSDEDPNFRWIQRNLPEAPMYGAVINVDDPTHIIVATEVGVYQTDNATSNNVQSWESANGGDMDQVPVFMIRQLEPYNQPWKGPTFYLGTHGRGIFYSEDFLTGMGPEKEEMAAAGTINAYPNPATTKLTLSVHLTGVSSGVVDIYDLHGRKIQSLQVSAQNGFGEKQLDVTSFKPGTYFARLHGEGKPVTAKFVVVR